MGAATSRAGGARARPRRYGLRLPSSSTPPIRCASSCPVDHLPQRSITKISHCTAVRLAQSRGRTEGVRWPTLTSRGLSRHTYLLRSARGASQRGVRSSVQPPTRNRTRLQRPRARQPSGVVDHQASLRVSASASPNVIRCKCSTSHIQSKKPVSCIWAHFCRAPSRPGRTGVRPVRRL